MVIMEPQQNPEKIPLNPIREQTSEKQLFQNPQIDSPATQNPVLDGMFKRSAQEPAIALRYKLLLAAMMLCIAIVAVIVGRVLFKDGLA